MDFAPAPRRGFFWVLDMAKKKDPIAQALAERPKPPESIVGVHGILSIRHFTPAQEVEAWARRVFLQEDSPLFNEEHQHLEQADLGFLWAATPNRRKGKNVVGLAEMPNFNCHQWQRERQEQQLREWFGHIPDFIITLYADYADECTDAQFCALVEHELLHCGQELDEFGAPQFKRTGEPKLTMRGHDCEEFVSIVRRYGTGAAAAGTHELVKAAMKVPEIAEANIAAVCGTCMIRNA